MSTPNDGGSAFPVPPETLIKGPNGDLHWTFPQPGMTLRDYFAAAALRGMCANPSWGGVIEERAATAYAQADAMLAERAKTKEGKL